jgi:DNA polymerase elongation subunit (family B)
MIEFILDIETNGLEKDINRITCISIKQVGQDHIYTIQDEDEKVLIEGLFKKLHHCDVIFHFNGDEFDMPFIIHRALITGAKGPTDFKFPASKDIRKIAGGFFFHYNKYIKGTLQDWGVKLGQEQKLTNGEEVANLWKEFEEKKAKLAMKEMSKEDFLKEKERIFAIIKEHCEYDIRLTELIFKRCRECGLI